MKLCHSLIDTKLFQERICFRALHGLFDGGFAFFPGQTLEIVLRRNQGVEFLHQHYQMSDPFQQGENNRATVMDRERPDVEV